MKQAFILLFAVAISSFACAQAFEGTVEYKKKIQQAIVIEYNFSSEALENAFMQKMEKLGNEGKVEKGMFNKDKGFLVYINAIIPDISNTNMDFQVKVDQKSRKEPDKALLYLIITKAGTNALLKMDAAGKTKVKTFLNNLLPDVEAADLELQIIAQEEDLAKSEKKFRNLQSDKEDMENKIKKLQDDIQKNLKDQEDAQKDIEKQKQLLESLKLKRIPVEKTL